MTAQSTAKETYAPIVDGYFVVATEIFDDSGCPHTLEHLVFMGSEKYPYKGIIDHFANRGFSNGTNAWTDNDHTAYTVSTAGEQGFLQLLPIYVDHILYPTLTKAGFITEVHHVNGKGEDSGVVYSEMQGRENTPGDLMALRMQRLSFPKGSAYQSETGGLMKALRKLTIEQIRDYHHTYYVPHNFTLIVAGKLASGTRSLLDVVQDKIEPVIVAHGQNKGPRPKEWKRPFLETPSANRPPFSQTITDVLEFPEQDESVGEVQIGYVGPHPQDFLQGAALDMLTTRSSLYIYAGSVPIEHLDSFDAKLQASLKRVVEEGIDMERMTMLIERDERQLRSKLESSKADTFSSSVIADTLYGAEDGSELGPSLQEIERYAEMRKWTSQDWTDLLKKYYIEPHRIVLVGKPSAALAKKLEEDERTRIAKQRKTLGEQGLKQAEVELEEAKKEHDKEIPGSILKSFPVPDVKSISWIPVQSLQEIGTSTGRKATVTQPYNNSDVKKYVESDGQALPFFVQYDHVKSDFVTISAYVSLAGLPDSLRPYVTPYTGSFFSLPVARGTGQRLTHEEVVNKLDGETVAYDIGFGTGGGFPEVMRVSIKVEPANYELAISWLRDLFYGSIFDKERLQVAVAKIQQNLPELKRDGNTVLSSQSASLLYAQSSTNWATTVFTLMDFIPQLSQRLQDDPIEVIKDFERVRKYVTEPSGVRFSVTGNVLSVTNPRSSWGKYFREPLKVSPLAPVRLASETLSKLGANPSRKAVVVSLHSIESSFASHHAKGLQGFNHPDYPALRIAGEVLNATESYLWRYIRGSGLAYGAYVSVDLEGGIVSFTLYRSSNSMEAFNQAKAVIAGLVDGSIQLDETNLDAAKSTTVYSITKSVSTPGRAALVSFSNQALKGVPQDYTMKLLEKFQAVTKQQVVEALRKYFLPLFDPATSVAAVVTAPGKSADIGAQLKKIGYEVEQRTLDVSQDIGDDSDFESDDSEGSESDSSR
ncbi:hypothetical protein NM688_g144 [Phlebia brevispora]|uniref:Uncharacterized protein n=1 Tax=Phlebia brevispora TaxID=194682 RepID=A0ACC1TF14_9APHY|nr:hypothetical protein NM688_g144 [Phlebia brevispora]